MKTIKIVLTFLLLWSFHNLMSQMANVSFESNDHQSGFIGSPLISPGFGKNIPAPFLNQDFDKTGLSGNNPASMAGAMEGEPRRLVLTGKSLFFDVHLGSSSLYNKDIRNSDWTNKSQLGYQVEFGYTKRLRINKVKIFSYGIGLGLSSYSHEISADSRYDTIHTMDGINVTPRDPVEFRVKYLSVSEKTNLKFVDVPVFIEIGNVNAKEIGYYVRLGVKVSFPISDKFDGKGNCSIKDFYEKYGVELDPVASNAINPYNEQLYSGLKNYELNSYNLSGLIAAGVSLPVVEKKWIIRLGASYIHGFTDITKTSNLTDNMIQTDVNHILENDKSPTQTRSLGVEIGFQYIIDLNF